MNFNIDQQRDFNNADFADIDLAAIPTGGPDPIDKRSIYITVNQISDPIYFGQFVEGVPPAERIIYKELMLDKLLNNTVSKEIIKQVHSGLTKDDMQQRGATEKRHFLMYMFVVGVEFDEDMLKDNAKLNNLDNLYSKQQNYITNYRPDIQENGYKLHDGPVCVSSANYNETYYSSDDVIDFISEVAPNAQIVEQNEVLQMQESIEQKAEYLESFFEIMSIMNSYIGGFELFKNANPNNEVHMGSSDIFYWYPERKVNLKELQDNYFLLLVGTDQTSFENIMNAYIDKLIPENISYRRFVDHDQNYGSRTGYNSGNVPTVIDCTVLRNAVKGGNKVLAYDFMRMNTGPASQTSISDPIQAELVDDVLVDEKLLQDEALKTTFTYIDNLKRGYQSGVNVMDELESYIITGDYGSKPGMNPLGQSQYLGTTYRGIMISDIFVYADRRNIFQKLWGVIQDIVSKILGKDKDQLTDGDIQSVNTLQFMQKLNDGDYDLEPEEKAELIRLFNSGSITFEQKLKGLGLYDDMLSSINDARKKYADIVVALKQPEAQKNRRETASMMLLTQKVVDIKMQSGNEMTDEDYEKIAEIVENYKNNDERSVDELKALGLTDIQITELKTQSQELEQKMFDQMKTNFAYGILSRSVMDGALTNRSDFVDQVRQNNPTVDLYSDIEGIGMWDFSDHTQEKMREYGMMLAQEVVVMALAGGLASVATKGIIRLASLAMKGKRGAELAKVVSNFYKLHKVYSYETALVGAADLVVEGTLFHVFASVLGGHTADLTSPEGYLRSIAFIGIMRGFGKLIPKIKSIGIDKTTARYVKLPNGQVINKSIANMTEHELFRFLNSAQGESVLKTMTLPADTTATQLSSILNGGLSFGGEVISMFGTGIAVDVLFTGQADISAEAFIHTLSIVFGLRMANRSMSTQKLVKEINTFFDQDIMKFEKRNNQIIIDLNNINTLRRASIIDPNTNGKDDRTAPKQNDIIQDRLLTQMTFLEIKDLQNSDPAKLDNISNQEVLRFAFGALKIVTGNENGQLISYEDLRYNGQPTELGQAIIDARNIGNDTISFISLQQKYSKLYDAIETFKTQNNKNFDGKHFTKALLGNKVCKTVKEIETTDLGFHLDEVIYSDAELNGIIFALEFTDLNARDRGKLIPILIEVAQNSLKYRPNEQSPVKVEIIKINSTITINVTNEYPETFRTGAGDVINTKPYIENQINTLSKMTPQELKDAIKNQRQNRDHTNNAHTKTGAGLGFMDILKKSRNSRRGTARSTDPDLLKVEFDGTKHTMKVSLDINSKTTKTDNPQDRINKIIEGAKNMDTQDFIDLYQDALNGLSIDQKIEVIQTQMLRAKNNGNYTQETTLFDILTDLTGPSRGDTNPTIYQNFLMQFSGQDAIIYRDMFLLGFKNMKIPLQEVIVEKKDNTQELDIKFIGTNGSELFYTFKYDRTSDSYQCIEHPTADPILTTEQDIIDERVSFFNTSYQYNPRPDVHHLQPLDIEIFMNGIFLPNQNFQTAERNGYLYIRSKDGEIKIYLGLIDEYINEVAYGKTKYEKKEIWNNIKENNSNLIDITPISIAFPKSYEGLITASEYQKLKSVLLNPGLSKNKLMQFSINQLTIGKKIIMDAMLQCESKNDLVNLDPAEIKQRLQISTQRYKELDKNIKTIDNYINEQNFMADQQTKINGRPLFQENKLNENNLKSLDGLAQIRGVSIKDYFKQDLFLQKHFLYKIKFEQGHILTPDLTNILEQQLIEINTKIKDYNNQGFKSKKNPQGYSTAWFMANNLDPSLTNYDANKTQEFKMFLLGTETAETLLLNKANLIEFQVFTEAEREAAVFHKMRINPFAVIETIFNLTKPMTPKAQQDNPLYFQENQKSLSDLKNIFTKEYLLENMDFNDPYNPFNTLRTALYYDATTQDIVQQNNFPNLNLQKLNMTLEPGSDLSQNPNNIIHVCGKGEEIFDLSLRNGQVSPLYDNNGNLVALIKKTHPSPKARNSSPKYTIVFKQNFYLASGQIIYKNAFYSFGGTAMNAIKAGTTIENIPMKLKFLRAQIPGDQQPQYFDYFDNNTKINYTPKDYYLDQDGLLTDNKPEPDYQSFPTDEDIVFEQEIIANLNQQQNEAINFCNQLLNNPNPNKYNTNPQGIQKIIENLQNLNTTDFRRITTNSKLTLQQIIENSLLTRPLRETQVKNNFPNLFTADQINILREIHTQQSDGLFNNNFGNIKNKYQIFQQKILSQETDPDKINKLKAAFSQMMLKGFLDAEVEQYGKDDIKVHTVLSYILTEISKTSTLDNKFDPNQLINIPNQIGGINITPTLKNYLQLYYTNYIQSNQAIRPNETLSPMDQKILSQLFHNSKKERFFVPIYKQSKITYEPIIESNQLEIPANFKIFLLNTDYENKPVGISFEEYALIKYVETYNSAMQKIVDNVEYYDFNTFYGDLHTVYQKFKTQIGNKNYLSITTPGMKSNDRTNRLLPTDPNRISTSYLYTDKTKIENMISTQNEVNLAFFDDGLYSGKQLKEYIEKSIEQVKKTDNFNDNIDINIFINIPKITTIGETNVKSYILDKYPDLKINFQYNNVGYIKTIGDISFSDAEIETIGSFRKSLGVQYNQRKVPDGLSFYKAISQYFDPTRQKINYKEISPYTYFLNYYEGQ